MPLISDVVGGRVDREHLHPGHLVSGVVIALDEPIVTGSTALFEFAVTYPPGYPPQRSAWHATARAARETLVWVRFHPDALLDWCEAYVETDAERTSSTPQVKTGAVHLARHGLCPVVLGVRWGHDTGSEPAHRHGEYCRGRS